MARINPENSADNIVNTVHTTSGNAALVCGVNRKVNVGNYETVDVYCSITLPIPNINGLMSAEELKPIIEDAAMTGFSLVSREVNDRYNLIKNS